MCAFASHHADARVIPDASAALAPAPTSFEKRLNELHELLACEKNFLLNQGHWEPGGGCVPEWLLVRAASRPSALVARGRLVRDVVVLRVEREGGGVGAGEAGEAGEGGGVQKTESRCARRRGGGTFIVVTLRRWNVWQSTCARGGGGMHKENTGCVCQRRV